MYFRCRIVIFLSLLCGLFSHVFAASFTGELEVKVIDDFTKNQAKVIYKLHDHETIYALQFDSDIKRHHLMNGQTVMLKGQVESTLAGKRIQVQAIKVVNHQPIPQRFPIKRNLLTILVDFIDKKATSILSPSAVEQQLFTDTASINANYKISSFQQFSFNPDTNRDGKTDIYVVKLNYNAADNCLPDQWAADAENALSRQGVNLAAYPHHFFILPHGVSCAWGGIGHLGCDFGCKAWVTGWSYIKGVAAHELGHNLGLHHASNDLNNDGRSDNEYGDLSCIMGSGFSQINAGHRDYLHWFDAFPKKIRTIEPGEYHYVIHALDANLQDSLQVLKIPKADGSVFYISFRLNLPPFGMSEPYVAKVNVHRMYPGDAHTFFITSLREAEEFYDPVSHTGIFVVDMDPKKVLVRVQNY